MKYRGEPWAWACGFFLFFAIFDEMGRGKQKKFGKWRKNFQKGIEIMRKIW
jgi:hypothetical protein